MTEQLRTSLVRFFTTSGTVVGTGFLITEKSLLSCAHVVATALDLRQYPAEKPEAGVRLDFPLLTPRQALTAHVIFWQPPQPDGGGDIAVLELDSYPPDGARPVRLVTAEDLWEHTFRAFGFPAGHDDGVWASGMLRGEQATDWLQIEDVKDAGYRVQQGFSGGAVLDNQLDGVVGMVVAEEREAGIKAAYIIPTTVLVKAWPALSQQTIPPCPYRELFAFREQDAPYFFGREVFITKQLIDAVRRKPFLAVVGSSGSGKSSVVFAGLIPNLRKEGSWLITSFRPGNRPFHSLAKALISWLEPQMSETDRLTEISKQAQRLQSGELALQDVLESIREKSTATHLLLIADQFEELYTLCREEEVRQRFLAELLTTVHAPLQQGMPDVHLLLTLRADFMERALEYRPFADALQNADLKLGPMNSQELQDAIEKPAKKMNVKIEDGLTGHILDDVSQQSGYLPLLQFALALLWAKQQYGKLTLAAYEEIGGVEKALAAHAEEVYAGLTEAEQMRAQRIFVQLVRPGEGTGDTRRLATSADIGEDNWDLVVRLSNARLVVTGRDGTTGEKTVEVVHEALIRGWQRLRNWIEGDRQFRTWQENLRSALRQWESRGRAADMLLPPVLLTEAKDWLAQRLEAISPAEKAFIEASQQYRDKEAQRWKELYEKEQQQRREAERQREEATRQREIAVQQRQLAEQRRQEAEQQRREAERQQEEAKRQREIAEQQRQLAVQQQHEAEQRRQEAEQQRREAERQREEAKRQREIAEQRQHEAEEQRRIAEQQRQEAEKQRQLALARQLVAQVELMREQQSNLLQLRVLLAVEALQRSPSPEANQALRRGLSLLPRTVTHLLPKEGLKALALSPDGRYLSTVNTDATIEIWEVISNRKLAHLPHEGMVKAVSFSRDGSYLATACEDRVAWVWETASGRQLARLPHDEDIKALALSPDKRYLATSTGRTARIWEVTNDRQLVRLLHDGIVYTITFSPDGNCFATASMDGTAQVWESASGRALTRLDHDRSVNAAVFSPIRPNGRYLATVSDDYTVRVWTWGTATNRQIAILQHESAVNAVAFSPDGKYLATASKDRVAQIWDAMSGRPITRLAHEESVNTVVFSADGRYLVTTSEDRTVGVWETSSGYRLLCLPSKDVGYTSGDKVSLVTISSDGRYLTTASENGSAGIWEMINGRLTHERGVNTVVFSCTGRYLATASEDRTAAVWEATSGRQLMRLTHEGNVWAVAFSYDERYLATAGEDGTARIWEIPAGRQIILLSHNKRNVNTVTFSPDGRYVATSSEDGTARIWEIPTGRQVTLLSHRDIVNAVTFSPDGKYVATASVDSSAKIWETASGRECAYLPHKRAVNTVVFSPNSHYLATASYDHNARIWETISGKQLALLPHRKYVSAIAFSCDGKYVATASKDGTARIWEIPGGRQLISMEHTDTVNAVSFSPDGKYLATACYDHTARVWEIASGHQLAYLTHEDSVNSIVFSPTGMTLATASADGTGRIWLWRSDDLITEANKRLTRNLTLEEWRHYIGDEPYRKTFPNLP